MSDTTLRYFLKDHLVLLNNFTKKNLPAFILILNKDKNFEQGVTLMLKLALENGRTSNFINFFEGF